MKILGHCCYIGRTGYAIHSKNFFRALSKESELKIRNYSIDSNWQGVDSKEVHGNSVDELDKQILALQTCSSDRGDVDLPIYNGIENFNNDYDIVLVDCFHQYYNNNYSGKKIFYNVWEKIRYSDSFFEKLKSADQVWVPTHWQYDCLIKQGLPEEKIKIVPEGIDPNELFPEDLQNNNKFTFLVLGKWERRKSTKEIVKAFAELFGNNDNVQLLLSCSNNFPDDGHKSTKQRLEEIGVNCQNIKIIDFQERHEVVKMIKSSHVFLSCARSEGWNLPLIESLACGIPSIYSNCSGQLEFAKGLGIPVKIHGEILDQNSTLFGYYDPDYNDLKKKMLEVYNSYEFYKQKALKDSDFIRETFTWEKAAKIAVKHLTDKFEKKNINIVNESNSLGDFIAWTPIVAKYAREKNTIVNYFTPYANILKNNYPELNFFDYNQKEAYGDSIDFKIGCFDDIDWRNKNLQEIACSILNLDYKEERCKIKNNNESKKLDYEKYVCIAVQTTGQFKYWNNKDGWFKTVDYLKSIGYKVVCIDKHYSFGSSPHINVCPNNVDYFAGNDSFEEITNILYNCDFFIGLSSGLSWLAWGLNKKVIRINNSVAVNFEFFTPYNVHNTNVCNSCFNNNKYNFARNNWSWCPENKDFECSKQITFEMVKEKIDLCINDINKKDTQVTLINFVSEALGDNIAHSPYPDFYQKKFGGIVYVASKWSNLFESQNSNVKFINKNESCTFDKKIDIYYRHGDCPIQKAICEDLDVEYKPVIPYIKTNTNHDFKNKKKYVCISTHSTSQMKYWNNPVGWRKTVRYLKSLGYDVICIDKYKYFGSDEKRNEIPVDAIDQTGDYPIEYRIEQIKNCEFFIGLSSGLSWLAWALRKKVVLITGISLDGKEFYTPYRVSNLNVCHGCCCKLNVTLYDKSWMHCPENKNFECTREISFEMAKQKIDQCINDLKINS
jgi:autotransporter strand-loop-strand O-heptosyltransferase